MEELQLQHAPEQWRLFVESSEVSLKTVLLHTGHKHPSIPLAHAVHMKESYTNIQGL
jgi:predicted esterase